jgi:hypothetical protein
MIKRSLILLKGLYVLELKTNKLIIAMRKELNTRGETDMIMIRIQALD